MQENEDQGNSESEHFSSNATKKCLKTLQRSVKKNQATPFFGGMAYFH